VVCEKCGLVDSLGFYNAEIVDGKSHITIPPYGGTLQIDEVKIPGYFVADDQIDFDGSKNPIQIQLLPGATLAGNIRFADGNIPAYSYIHLYSDDEYQSISEEYNSNTGTYIFHSLNPNKEYILSYSRGIGSDRKKKIRFSADNLLRKQDLVLNPIRKIEVQIFRKGEGVIPNDFEIKYDLGTEGGGWSHYGSQKIEFEIDKKTKFDKLDIQLLIGTDFYEVDLLEYDLDRGVIRIDLEDRHLKNFEDRWD
jgi:hypothetical protein